MAESSRSDLPKKDTAPIAEALRQGIGIEIQVLDDFSSLLTSINTATNAHLMQRPEGLHITVITPREKAKVRALHDKEVTLLKDAYAKLSSPGELTITGVGFIDADTRNDTLPQDKGKKTAYIAVDVPSLRQFRKEIGLPEKDFHITLGIQGEDIHERVAETQSGKMIAEAMPKKADAALSLLAPQSVHIGELYILRSLKPFAKTTIR